MNYHWCYNFVQGEIESIASKINDEHIQALAKKIIVKRRRKRARVKRNQLKSKESNKMAISEKLENEKCIDSWLISIQESQNVKKRVCFSIF